MLTAEKWEHHSAKAVCFDARGTTNTPRIRQVLGAALDDLDGVHAHCVGGDRISPAFVVQIKDKIHHVLGLLVDEVPK